MVSKIKCPLFLLLLVLFPVFFLFGHRTGYLIPFNTGTAAGDTELIVLLFAVYFLTSLPYWYLVGYVFGRTTVNFFKSFFLGNLPIFINTVGEITYFGLLGMEQNTVPVVEYLIGSHIDKFNVEWIEPVIPSILFSAACFLVVFSLGYIVGKKGLKNLLLLR